MHLNGHEVTINLDHNYACWLLLASYQSLDGQGKRAWYQSLDNPKGQYKETMNIPTCTCTHKEHNKIYCVVQVECHVGRSGHLESASELRYCDLR